MYELIIKSSTPEEFKERVKGLYALFSDSKDNAIDSTQPKKDAAKSTGVKPEGTQAAQSKTDKISVEDVRKAVQEKTTANEAHKNAVKSILSEFGAPSVTKLDPAKYPDFLAKIKALV